MAGALKGMAAAWVLQSPGTRLRARDRVPATRLHLQGESKSHTSTTRTSFSRNESKASRLLPSWAASVLPLAFLLYAPPGCTISSTIASDSIGDDEAVSPPPKCDPGFKPCPPRGDGKCVPENDPEYGCKNSTLCLPCSLDHATAACTETGLCTIDTCDEGWSDCRRDDDDGCETNSDIDWRWCGPACVQCDKQFKNAFNLCRDGKCTMGACNPGFFDCNEDDSDGCESSDPCDSHDGP